MAPAREGRRRHHIAVKLDVVARGESTRICTRTFKVVPISSQSPCLVMRILVSLVYQDGQCQPSVPACGARCQLTLVALG